MLMQHRRKEGRDTTLAGVAHDAEGNHHAWLENRLALSLSPLQTVAEAAPTTVLISSFECRMETIEYSEWMHC